MSRRSATLGGGGPVTDQLALKIREVIRREMKNAGSGVERFTLTQVSPLQIEHVDGDLTLEEGDPDFTIGAWFDQRRKNYSLAVGDQVWCFRADDEWHAVDVTDIGTAWPGGAVGGDLSGSLPDPTVAHVLGGHTPMIDGQSAGGVLAGTYPNPTLAPVTVPRVIVSWAEVPLTAAHSPSAIGALVSRSNVGGIFTVGSTTVTFLETGVYDFALMTRADADNLCYGQVAIVSTVSGGYYAIGVQDNSYQSGVVYQYRQYTLVANSLLVAVGESVEVSFLLAGAGDLTFHGDAVWPGAVLSITKRGDA